MVKFSQVAIKSIELITKEHIEPRQAWQISVEEIFKESPSAISKNCPKSAFLVLCQEGLINGVPKGNYTDAIETKDYILSGLELIKNDSTLANNPSKLWDKVVNENKAHNQRMHILCDIYKKGYINID